MADVRVLSRPDAEAMARLRRRGYETDPLAFAGSVDSDPTCQPEVLRTKLATQTLESGSIVMGAFVPELVGLLGLVREEPGKFTHKGRLWGFYVEPQSRRAGVGRSLISEAAQRARAWGLEQLTLRVCVECEAAIAAYGKFGFESFGREPRALKAASGYFDELHMMALLSRLAV